MFKHKILKMPQKLNGATHKMLYDSKLNSPQCRY